MNIKDSPELTLAILIILLIEIGIIMNTKTDYFHNYIDIVVVISFIGGAYCAIKYFFFREKIPVVVVDRFVEPR